MACRKGILLIPHRSICFVTAAVIAIAAYGEEEAAVADSTVEPATIDELTRTIAQALSNVSVEGWVRSSVERYVVENLYDKIDGRSELFMSYGVRGMVFATFTQTGQTSRFIDVFLYDMSSVPGAFGVFSVERWGEWEAMPWGREGYRTDTDAFFWKGAYYVSILGSSNESEVRDAQQVIANELAKALPDTKGTLWGLTALPDEALIPGSVRYFMVDAMSLSFMEDTFTAQYRYGEVDVTAFVSKQPDDSDARETCDAFVGYMKKYGEDVGAEGDKEGQIHVADMGGGYYDAVFYEGSYVAGVTSVPGRGLALEAANKLRSGLRAER
jgi:hypothetical protein